jgi:hypothetical protein
MLLRKSFVQRIFENDDMQSIPIGAQSTAVHAIEDILNEIREENPDATIYELFEPNSHADNEQPSRPSPEAGIKFTESACAGAGSTGAVSADDSPADADGATESNGAAEYGRRNNLYC